LDGDNFDAFYQYVIADAGKFLENVTDGGYYTAIRDVARGYGEERTKKARIPWLLVGMATAEGLVVLCVVVSMVRRRRKNRHGKSETVKSSGKRSVILRLSRRRAQIIFFR
jgi:hypothetical protein